MAMLTAGSLFSGIGGLDLAASIAGFDIRFQVEIDPFCRKVLAKHAADYWKNATQFADICGLSGLETVDVLFGGFPCQDISHAGKGVGLEGARSGLWWEFYRLIGEIRPRAVVLENVAAIAYAGRGGTEVIAALAGLGYSAQWGIVSAADAGAPHQRNRWFCVGYADSCRFTESHDTTRRQNPRDEIRAIEIRQYDRFITGKSRSIRRILRAKTGLAYPYRQRRTETRGYRAEARERLIRTGAVGYTNSQYLKEQRFRFHWEAELQTFGCDGEGIAGTAGANEPGMGRDADGISAKLDGNRLMQHRWVARPNELQHEDEPPRLCGKLPDRRARIKALGNAVVPQVAYPIFKLLAEYLTETR